jgi:hypothetical protein
MNVVERFFLELIRNFERIRKPIARGLRTGENEYC